MSEAEQVQENVHQPDAEAETVHEQEADESVTENELSDQHEHKHSHSHRHRHKSKLRPVLYSMLSFFLAFALFLLSVCAVMYSTVFSKNYILNIMRNNGYYEMVRSELQSQMENLVDASGFDKEFADSFVRSCNIQDAVEKYISAFYSGETTLVDTISFKQKLYAAIDVYISDKNIKVNDETNVNISYFVNEAADIYVAQISIPFFSTIANYIYKGRSVLNAVTASLAVFALVVIAIIFFTNKYKHRRFRYLFIGSSAGMLAVTVLPTVVFISDRIRKINLTTRSIYNLFVDYFNGLFSSFYIWAGVLLAASVFLLILYIRHYRRATS